jgi:hypothetical protein
MTLEVVGMAPLPALEEPRLTPSVEQVAEDAVDIVGELYDALQLTPGEAWPA